MYVPTETRLLELPLPHESDPLCHQLPPQPVYIPTVSSTLNVNS
jgi:hypothetical protein